MSKKVTPSGNPADHVAVFQEIAIRRTWHKEEWWFSVVDVCGVLTASPEAGAYWRKLKQRLGAEGSEVVTFCHDLKLEAPDGKQRLTDCGGGRRGEVEIGFRRHIRRHQEKVPKQQSVAGSCATRGT